MCYNYMYMYLIYNIYIPDQLSLHHQQQEQYLYLTYN